MASTWDGWQADLLRAANIIVTPPNMEFLSGWHQHAHSPGCDGNPIDLSKTETGSGNCAANTGVGAWGTHTQHYATHASAGRAFDTQMHTAWVKPLLDALNTGNPFQIGAALEDQVVSVLFSWGSSEWAQAYDKQYKGAVTSSSGGSSTDIHHGWTSIRRSLNRTWPKRLHSSQRNVHAALRAVSHSRKVRR